MDTNAAAPQAGVVSGVIAEPAPDRLNPGDPGWNSYVQAPLVLRDETAVTWGDTADIVVVGFGAAGASAALEARDAGADVLIVDRFNGGGATAASGGVIYAGGGTIYQKEAGFEDSVEDLFSYLKMETQGVITDETLRRFCADSRANLAWVQSHGATFSSAFYKEKTIYPPEGKFLYYAGNEMVPSYRAVSRPAPRGHRTVGRGVFCGAPLYAALSASAERNGARVLRHAPVMRLVKSATGEVLGVEVHRLRPGTPAFEEHDKAIRKIDAWLRFVPPKVKALDKRLRQIESQDGEKLLIRARRGVILSAGGFAFNEAMVAQHAPAYARGFPIGSAGCDGSGIRLGQSVGGAARRLYSISATRNISPPPEYIRGAIVDAAGKRFIAEDVYASSLGRAIAEHGSAKNYLIIDRAMHRAAWRMALSFGPGWLIMSFPILRTLLRNCVGASSATALAAKIGLPRQAFEDTLKAYNALSPQNPDSLGKADYNLCKLEGKLYAIDISTDNTNTTCMILTMGGLAVDERTGQVLRENGAPVGNLYAAGRTAVGLPSHYYVSGTSLADCVFSGRRAGGHAARHRSSTA